MNRANLVGGNFAQMEIRVKTLLRGVLWRTLSPESYHAVRFRWWCLSCYVPRVVASWFLKQTPQVRGFGAGGSTALTQQLRSVNVSAPTRMCRIMTKYGSDKGHGWHNYTTVYSVLFKDCQGRPLRILEIGLGSNNPDQLSSMGSLGVPGASVRGWRELFPRAVVFGADIDRAILFQEERIKTFYCDQLDQTSIRELWSQTDLQDGMDIIIEDGLHTFEANVSFLEGSLDHLRPGGVYVTEDILGKLANNWYEWAEAFAKRYPSHEVAFVILPNSVNPDWDNNLLIVRRGRE